MQAWEACNQLIDANHAVAVELTELFRNRFEDDWTMTTDDKVHFGFKAFAGKEARLHAIVIDVTSSPERHISTSGHGTTVQMTNDIGGTGTVGDKPGEVHNRGLGDIRDGHKIVASTTCYRIEVGDAGGRMIEDNSPERIGSIGIETAEMGGYPEIVPGAVEKSDSRGKSLSGKTVKLGNLEGFLRRCLGKRAYA